MDASLVSDEFNECYVAATLRLKSDNTTKDSFWVGKFDTTGDLLWNYRYVAPSGQSIQVAQTSVIDIFGDLNVAFTRTDNTTTYKTVDTVKIGYDGKLKSHTNNEFNKNNIEGISAHALLLIILTFIHSVKPLGTEMSLSLPSLQVKLLILVLIILAHLLALVVQFNILQMRHICLHIRLQLLLSGKMQILKLLQHNLELS